MSQPDLIPVSLDDDVVRSINFIRTHNIEAETISPHSFGIYASGVERDGDVYTTDWMKEDWWVAWRVWGGTSTTKSIITVLCRLGWPLVRSSKTSATVSDLLDRIRLASATDETMLGHIGTVQEVAEDGLFDVDRAYGFSRSTDQQSGEISKNSEDAEEAVGVGA
jgi:hypothetical protein